MPIDVKFEGDGFDLARTLTGALPILGETDGDPSFAFSASGVTPIRDPTQGHVIQASFGVTRVVSCLRETSVVMDASCAPSADRKRALEPIPKVDVRHFNTLCGLFHTAALAAKASASAAAFNISPLTLFP